MFLNVERFVWRQMGIAMAVLVFWFLAAGLYFDGAVWRTAIGTIFIALVFCVCLYISLLQTRGMRWADAGIAMAVMLPTMAMASYGSRDAPAAHVLGFELLLVVAIYSIRVWAKRRWTDLDWMLCKPTRAA
jgi:uncharacterized membrane protein